MNNHCYHITDKTAVKSLIEKAKDCEHKVKSNCIKEDEEKTENIFETLPIYENTPIESLLDYKDCIIIYKQNDLNKEQERDIKQKLKKVNKAYKQLGEKKLKIKNKTIKSYEYLINVRIFKLYDDNENKKVKHHWQFVRDSANTKYVIFRMFNSYKMLPSFRFRFLKIYNW